MDSNAQAFIPKKDRGLDSFRRSVRRNVRRGRGRGMIGAVLRGVLVSASITVIAVALFALILNWWNASDRAITAINQVVKFVSILAAPEGVERLAKTHPDVQIYTGGVDEKLNEKGYIVPGLGDAGDRLFGTL